MEKRLRFKTQEEFEKEHGRVWRNIIGWSTECLMDYLCGTEVPSDAVARMQDNPMRTCTIEGPKWNWRVSLSDTVPLEEPTMLVEDPKTIIIKPDYSGDPDFLLAPIKCDF